MAGRLMGGNTALQPIGAYKYYGLVIDTANSDPLACVTYIDDAAEMTKGSSNWDSTPIFTGIRPCILKNGVVQHYLNPENRTQKEDGSPAVLNDAAVGDVMVEIPKLGYKIEKDGTQIFVHVTNDPNAKSSGYCYYAHSIDAEGDCDKIYIGTYLSTQLALNDETTATYWSISGATPTKSTTRSSSLQSISYKGDGYSLFSFFQLVLIQCLYLFKYGSLDSQTAIGRGAVSGASPVNTGGTDGMGRDYGTQNATTQVCFENIEDLWGNLYQNIDGVYVATGMFLKTDYRRDANSNPENFMFSSNVGFSNQQNAVWVTDVIGTNETGFFPCAGTPIVSQYNSTYFCDAANVNQDCYSLYGGHYNDIDYAGIFLQSALVSNDQALNNIAGDRIMYRHKEV